MKTIKFLILFLSFLISSFFSYAQFGPGRNADPEQHSKPYNEKEIERMIKNGGLLLRQIEAFPFKKIIENNKDIGSISISNSHHLSFITPEIENFKKLKNLSISETKIKEMPNGIFKLLELQYLSYRINQTSKIPKEIGNLSQLKGLSLLYLPITVLPNEIGKLTVLENLEIANNKGRCYIAGDVFELEGIKILPKEIGNCIELKMLSLYNNGFESIPKQIGNLTNITYLALFKNNIESLPKEIGNLKMLQTLELSENPLKNLPNTIGNLSNLQILNISNTEIETLPKSIEKLINLKMLNVKGTKITEFELNELKKKLPNTRIYNGQDID
ncbi:MAG TPA: hypothetical protein VLZ83_10845 [Edaphocola sp.]|nr:hypothetical protein [Edaphocola sp.]